MKDYLAVGFTVIVLIVWILAIIGGIIRRDWTAVNIITPVVLTAAGWLYFRKNGKNNAS
jgi:ATP/ADP translocase